PSVEAYAIPIAASAMSQSTPPCRVPIGLAWRASASKSTTACPTSTSRSVNPMSVAIGGAGNSPLATFRILSSMVLMSSPSVEPRALSAARAPGAGADGGGHRGAEGNECQRDDDVERGEAAAEHTRHEPGAPGSDAEAQESRDERPRQTSRALRREVERQAEPEESIERADDPQIHAARRQNGGLRREESDPEPRGERHHQADSARHGGREGGAD